MADAQPMAHMMKGLIPRIAPLVDVITRAGPDQVVQCIVTSSYKAQNSREKNLNLNLMKRCEKLSATFNTEQQQLTHPVRTPEPPGPVNCQGRL